MSGTHFTGLVEFNTLKKCDLYNYFLEICNTNYAPKFDICIMSVYSYAIVMDLLEVNTSAKLDSTYFSTFYIIN